VELCAEALRGNDAAELPHHQNTEEDPVFLTSRECPAWIKSSILKRKRLVAYSLQSHISLNRILPVLPPLLTEFHYASSIFTPPHSLHPPCLPSPSHLSLTAETPFDRPIHECSLPRPYLFHPKCTSTFHRPQSPTGAGDEPGGESEGEGTRAKDPEFSGQRGSASCPSRSSTALPAAAFGASRHLAIAPRVTSIVLECARPLVSHHELLMCWAEARSFVGLSGGQIFHEMMLRQDVKHIFGYPGGAILPVFDAIYNSKHFDFVLPRHEQGAGHMAEGYARVSGKPGVVLVTSGPGATNVITPMQDALSDGVPMVVFCGQVATNLIGSDSFQEADVVGISRSCTKWNVMVKEIAELPRRINEAFKIATTGRPGPVLVDLPKDVTAAILRTPIPAKSVQTGASPYLPSSPLNPATVPSRPRPGEASLIAAAAKMINGAKRPIIYAGAGVLSSPDGPRLLKELSDIANIPVTTTLQGLGAYDERDPKSLHMLGMHGSAYANFAIQEADVLIALGARFDDRVTGKVDSELACVFSTAED